MESLVVIALWNVAGAAALAIVAAMVSRVWRRPAVSHALWVLVLVKLIAPPVWTIHFPGVWNSDAGSAHVVAPSVAADQHLNLGNAGSKSIAPETHPMFRVSTWDAVGLLWVLGSMGCLSITGWRLLRFRGVLKYGIAAPVEVQRMTDEVAGQLGLRARVMAWMLPGPVCPMVWAGWGRPRVLLPAELWGRLSNKQRRRLLAHELAHVSRGDHWVRWLEVLATAAYWWNPVLWWARHELHEAEEACCDAWVAWAYPEDSQEYASALVEAIEFATVRGAGRGRPLPALASGVGGFRSLKRRLIMIHQGRTTRTLGGFGITCVCAAALLLPLSCGQSGNGPAQAAQSAPSGIGAPSAQTAPATQSAEDRQLDERVRALLDKTMPAVQFDAVGFSDVIDFLRDVSGAKIYVQWKILEAVGVAPNTPVTVSGLRNAKFSNALDLVLEGVGEGRAKLTYAVERGVITITASDAVPVTLVTHDLKQLFALKPELAGVLVHQIVTTIDPKSWQDAGGKKGMISLKDGKLYVAQTLENQKLVSQYLSKIWPERQKAATQESDVK